MNILALVLFVGNLYFALVQGLRFSQTGSLLTLGVGLVNAIACGFVVYGHFQRVKSEREWNEFIRKREMEGWTT